ncbi:hypothetical protein [Bacillus sonorensis]|nr:hypothetical protein CHCC20335_1039 [Bacillus paralicheniformis]
MNKPDGHPLKKAAEHIAHLYRPEEFNQKILERIERFEHGSGKGKKR